MKAPPPPPPPICRVCLRRLWTPSGDLWCVRAPSNLSPALSPVCVCPQSKSKLREDISSVHDVMKRNISEVLDRGTKLERAWSPARLPCSPLFCHFLLSRGLS